MVTTLCSGGISTLIYNCGRFNLDHKTKLIGLELFVLYFFNSVISVHIDTHLFGAHTTSQHEVINDEDNIQTQGLKIHCVVFIFSQKDDGL